jgi:hypothetical protein
MNTELIKSEIDSSRETLEFENQQYVDNAFEKYPKLFKEFLLKDGSNVAILFNDSLISQEGKEILPKYEYIALSKYGLTQFNTSNIEYLGYGLLVEAITSLIEKSDDEEVYDLPITEWKKPIRNRINKGLLKLEAIVRTVYISGKNIPNGVEDFYSQTIKRLHEESI